MPPAEHIIFFFFKLNYYYLYSDNSFITRHIITSRENDFFDTSWWKLLLKNELNGLSWVTLKIILVSKVHVFSRYFRSRIEATIVSLWILNPSTIHKYIEPPNHSSVIRSLCLMIWRGPSEMLQNLPKSGLIGEKVPQTEKSCV